MRESQRQAIAQYLTLATVLTTAYLGLRQLRLARNRHDIDSLQTALNNLSSTVTILRVGGVQALDTLSSEEPAFRETTAIILLTHLRSEIHHPGSSAPSLDIARPDRQLALRNLSKMIPDLDDLPQTQLTLAAANLDFATFENLTFIGVVFERCSMKEAILVRAIFKDCSFVDADLSGADLSESTFLHCDFTGANVTDAVGSGADFTDSTFHNLVGTGAMLSNCDMKGVSRVGTDPDVVDFVDCVNLT